MSLSDLDVLGKYTANGVTTTFSIAHAIVESDSNETLVYTIDESVVPPVKTLKVEGALQDYTLTGASPPTTPFNTTVTFNAAPTSGLKVLVVRAYPLTQNQDINATDAVPLATIELASDRLVAMIQMLSERIGRALKFRLGYTALTDVDVPDPVANTYLRWNAGATALTNATVVGALATGVPYTDNSIIRWDGTDGTTIQGSLVIISDAGAITGVTALTVDSLKLDGQVLSTTGSNLDVQITPHGTGAVAIPKLMLSMTADNTTTGSGQAVVAATSVIRFQNASLVSISNFTGPVGAGQELVIFNTTGVPITLINSSGGTASTRILTGSGSNLTVPDQAAVSMFYDGSTQMWRVTGIQGSGTVAGPGASTDNAVVRWDGTGGGIMQNSVVIISDAGAVSGVTSLAMGGALSGVTTIDASGNVTLAGLTASRAVVTDGSKVLTSSATTATEIGYVSGVTSAIQTQVNTKAPSASPTFTGTVTFSGLTASTVPYLDASKVLTSSAVTPTELGYLSGVSSAIQTQMNLKAPLASPTFTGTITTPLTASRAVVTGASSELAASAVTSTELGYVSGVSSAIQTQLDAKQLRSTLTAKGDLYVATASNTVARQAVGTDGYVLTADSAQTNGVKWAAASGGGASLRWYTGESNAPLREVFGNGLELFEFEQTDDQAIYAKFTLPASYGGARLYLKKGKMFSVTTSGNVLFQATSYIYKANVAGNSTPTGYTSTNAQQAINGTTNLISLVSDIDLTDASKQINGVTVAAGDTIGIKLVRKSSSETSGVADTVKLLIDSFELVIS